MTLHDVWYRYPAPTVQLPKRFAAPRWADLPTGPFRDATERYLRGFEAFFAKGQAPVFLGRAREYKTYALALLSLDLVGHYRIPVEWVNVPAQIAACERDRYSAATQQRVEHWQTCPFLVLDDFATQVPGQYGANLLVALASARFDAMLPTAWSGNVAPGTTTPWQTLLPWGPTFCRRLHDTGKGLTVFVS